MVNSRCSNCGDLLTSDYANKYCSQECFHSGHSFAGPNNPNYRGGKATTECELCGIEFEYYPSEKPGRFCGTCVDEERWQTSPGLIGSENPQWQGGKVEASCDVCGASFKRHRSALTGDTTLCSRECQATLFSETYSGEGHPNWKGGGSEYYGKGWRRAKLKTLIRDEYSCQLCGVTDDQLGRNPDVHHIVPVRSFIHADGATKEDAHMPRNLITLCVTCHRRADFGRPSKSALKMLATQVK